jgi:hypothetical protein
VLCALTLVFIRHPLKSLLLSQCSLHRLLFFPNRRVFSLNPLHSFIRGFRKFFVEHESIHIHRLTQLARFLLLKDLPAHDLHLLMAQGGEFGGLEPRKSLLELFDLLLHQPDRRLCLRQQQPALRLRDLRRLVLGGLCV